jgi:5'-nucleotidase (lipoprotein e(P4) family)
MLVQVLMRFAPQTARLLACMLMTCMGLAHAQSADSSNLPVKQRELLIGTLWMQTAHEYRYNAEQTYLMARSQLKSAISKAGSASLEQQAAGHFSKLPPAVVVDLDETMLDNSAFQAYLIQRGEDYKDPLWDQWVGLRQAQAVPGALAFARAVSQSGAKIFYITNRKCAAPTDCPAKAATMANMKALGFPRASDPSAFLLQNEKPEWAGDKVTRRQAVAQNYRIVMLLGDDLQDFMSANQAKVLREGTDTSSTDAYSKLIGQRWFVLPNPMYGSWKRALPADLPGYYGALKPAPLGGVITPPPPADLTLATWNLEWMMTPQTYDALLPTCNKTRQPNSNERAFPCSPGHPPVPRRSQADLDAMARVAERIHADVVALEEVDGPEAAAQVFRQGWKVDCFVRRAHPQKVGFAIRDHIPYRCNAEYIELDIDGATRAGADITLYPGTTKEVRLLAVHLKSGCFTGSLSGSSNSACPKLQEQVPVLERWVDARASEGVAYAVLGDFNRRLEIDAGFSAGPDEAHPTSVFAALNDGTPVGATLKRATEGQPDVKCSTQDHNPPSPIDNLLISAMLVARSTALNFERITYDNNEAATLKLSDHCPATLRLVGAMR